MASTSVITQDFQGRIPNAEYLEERDSFDERNKIYARDMTYSVESYLGYLNWSKLLVMQTCRNDHMLRLGFLPVCMPPSFWDEQARKTLLEPISNVIPVYTQPAVSFTVDYYSSIYPDFWASKMDAAEICRCEPEEVTVRRLFAACGICQ